MTIQLAPNTKNLHPSTFFMGTTNPIGVEIFNVTQVFTNPTNAIRPVEAVFNNAISPASAAIVPTDYHTIDAVVTGGNNMNNLTGLYAVEGQAVSGGAGQILKGVGVFGLGYNTGTGGAVDLIGIQAWVQNTSNAVLTRATAIYVPSNTNVGGGSIGTNYGLKIEDQTAGTTNYAIWCGLGSVHFGGAVDAASFTANGGNILATSGVIWGKNFQAGATAQAAPSSVDYYTASGYGRQARVFSGGSLRLAYGTAGETESGSDVGCDYTIGVYNDAGTFIDSPLRIQRKAGVPMTVSRPVIFPAMTVASLPAAASYPYARCFVTDANATTFYTVAAGGGANKVPVFSDGTNWRIG
jgi:hypothetical protein